MEPWFLSHRTSSSILVFHSSSPALIFIRCSDFFFLEPYPFCHGCTHISAPSPIVSSTQRPAALSPLFSLPCALVAHLPASASAPPADAPRLHLPQPSVSFGRLAHGASFCLLLASIFSAPQSMAPGPPSSSPSVPVPARRSEIGPAVSSPLAFSGVPCSLGVQSRCSLRACSSSAPGFRSVAQLGSAPPCAHLPWLSALARLVPARVELQLGACFSPLLRVSNSSIARAKFSARHNVSSFHVEFLSSVPVVVSEPILDCCSIFSYPGCVCGRQACLLPWTRPGAHSISGPRFLQLGQAGNRFVCARVYRRVVEPVILCSNPTSPACFKHDLVVKLRLSLSSSVTLARYSIKDFSWRPSSFRQLPNRVVMWWADLLFLLSVLWS
jgi:hypothetical protein